MNITNTLKKEYNTWELPEFDVTQYLPKMHRHALVIPVINEGEKIRDQLNLIMHAEPMVDVIIADGGSDDGSLTPDQMLNAKVTAVLTKQSCGKLSTQLRMAYAWCILQGYEGIVTIDGNGKDGVEAISHMVFKLNEGFDYIQGSRYLSGGAAENTPLDRTLGNRLIHAPLLSLSGRYFFSDTTNGFRAYSVNYLLHPKVRPFRKCFSKYELLFYLTIRAGQLGMKITQIPVTRSYPYETITPTKINGLSGKLSLLLQTLFVVMGRYHP